MTREQRVGIALRLHELACEMARLGIRRQHPGVSEAEVQQLLRQRLELVNTAIADAALARGGRVHTNPRAQAFVT